MQVSGKPDGCAVICGPMRVTCPDVDAWTGSIFPVPVVNACPRRTLSPTLTKISPSCPICCRIGIISCSGRGSDDKGVALDCDFISGGWIPPLKSWRVGSVFCLKKLNMLLSRDKSYRDGVELPFPVIRCHRNWMHCYAVCRAGGNTEITART